MPTELDACIFDFGGVLTTSIRASFQAFEQVLGIPEGALLAAFLGHPEDAEPEYFLLEKGLISEGEFYDAMLTRLREQTGIDVRWPDQPEQVRRKLFGALERNDDMIEAAVRIGAHYKTAILTNNVREWKDWRELVDAHVFELIVDSSDVGLRKPDPEIYHLTCERLDVKPDRAAFIDDIPSNVEGAKAVGLHAIHFRSTEQVLDELRPLFPKAFQEPF